MPGRKARVHRKVPVALTRISRFHSSSSRLRTLSHAVKARRSDPYARWVASERPPCSRKRSIAACVSTSLDVRRAAWVAYIALALLLAAAPFLTDAALGRSWVRILDFALLYIMLALGLNIVVGYAGLLDLGYIAFYAVGAYLYALLASPHFGLHLPVWAILPMGAMVAAGFGVLLGAPTLKLRGDYLAIVTLGFGEIIRIFLTNLNAPINITNGPQGISLVDPISIGGLSLGETHSMFGITLPSTYTYYYLFLALSLAIVFISIRLQDSRIGRAWVAIREDEVAAAAMGINTRNVKLLAFAMGASFAGVSGGPLLWVCSE